MTAKLFESALGIAAPWTVASVEFDEKAKTLTVLIDFKPGSRFSIAGHDGVHPVHDTVTKTYRHLNFFQHECHLQVRTPSRETAQRLGAPGRTRTLLDD
jgi:transposase